MADQVRRRPRPPTHLGTAGRKLWRQVVSEYVLDPAELALLGEAARTADELEHIRAVLAGAHPIVLGSRRQQVSHPLLQQARAHRATLAALLEQIALPLEGEQVGSSARSRQARRAAQTRWQRRDDLAARRAAGGPPTST